jgi:tryptophan-rich sensory protein
MQATTARPAFSSRSTSRSVLAAVIFAAVTVAVAGVGSIATQGGMDWYDRLDRPGFTPPDATFGIVWTILYVVVAVAGWLAWRSTDDRRPTAAWAVQMALNLAWTAVFFGLESPWGGLVVIALLIAAVALDIRISARTSTVAAALLVPYLLWCCFAAALNVGIVVLN